MCCPTLPGPTCEIKIKEHLPTLARLANTIIKVLSYFFPWASILLSAYRGDLALPTKSECQHGHASGAPIPTNRVINYASWSSRYRTMPFSFSIRAAISLPGIPGRSASKDTPRTRSSASTSRGFCILRRIASNGSRKWNWRWLHERRPFRGGRLLGVYASDGSVRLWASVAITAMRNKAGSR